MTEEMQEDASRAATPPWGPKDARGPIREVISGHRFYNPDLGRWVNRDPIGERGGVNLFSMCENNSISYYDIKGTEKKGDICDALTIGYGNLNDYELVKLLNEGQKICRKKSEGDKEGDKEGDEEGDEEGEVCKEDSFWQCCVVVIRIDSFRDGSIQLSLSRAGVWDMKCDEAEKEWERQNSLPCIYQGKKKAQTSFKAGYYPWF